MFVTNRNIRQINIMKTYITKMIFQLNDTFIKVINNYLDS